MVIVADQSVDRLIAVLHWGTAAQATAFTVVTVALVKDGSGVDGCFIGDGNRRGRGNECQDGREGEKHN